MLNDHIIIWSPLTVFLCFCISLIKLILWLKFFTDKRQAGNVVGGGDKKHRVLHCFKTTGTFVQMLVTQLCLTLCDPIDCRPQASSVHGICQARILEWVAISNSRGSSWVRYWTCVSYIFLHWQADSLPLHPLGSPELILVEFNSLGIIQRWCLEYAC